MIKLLFTSLLLIATCEGLRCFVCTMSGSDSSDLCITSPSSIPGTPSVECNLRYCTIRRQEYQNPPGKIAAFHRGCESNPVHLNTIIDSDEFKTYYRACEENLCNTGNGIQPVNSKPGSNVISLMVPGRGTSSSYMTLPNTPILCLVLLLSIFSFYNII